MGRTENKMDGKILKISTFQVTLSPKEDISPESVDDVLKWIKKQCLMYYGVYEYGSSGKKHAHFMVIFKEPKEGKRIQDDVWRKVRKYHPTSIGGIAVKVQVCPGNKWYDEYLQKESSREVFADNWDRDAAVEFFPSESEQQFMMSKDKGPKDRFINELVESWVAAENGSSFLAALSHLRHRQYVSQVMRCILDERRERQIARAMYMYRNKIDDVSAPDETWFDHSVGGSIGNHRDSSRGAAGVFKCL